jgi:hypothetical protein
MLTARPRASSSSKLIERTKSGLITTKAPSLDELARQCPTLFGEDSVLFEEGGTTGGVILERDRGPMIGRRRSLLVSRCDSQGMIRRPRRYTSDPLCCVPKVTEETEIAEAGVISQPLKISRSVSCGVRVSKGVTSRGSSVLIESSRGAGPRKQLPVPKRLSIDLC